VPAQIRAKPSLDIRKSWAMSTWGGSVHSLGVRRGYLRDESGSNPGPDNLTDSIGAEDLAGFLGQWPKRFWETALSKVFGVLF
jgi:hypothetical protein